MQGNFFYICINLLTYDENEILECFYDAGRDMVGAAADCRMRRQGAPTYGGGNGSDNVIRRTDAGAAGDFSGGLLRTPCTDLTEEDLLSEVYEHLACRMIATVTDSTQDGVGLAAPQVGLNRRVVAVMRYDKPGYPFEVYPNIHIEYFSEQKQTGPEGCLSIPDIAGDVERSQQVVIRYTDPETLSEVRDTVDGYTAVIFQHEVDHLDGILFTDRLTVPAGSAGSGR